MKKSRVCPKCNSRDILTNQNTRKQGHRTFIGINTWSTITIATYVCMSCGYIEEYLDEKAMNNSSKIDKLRQNWQKL